MTDEFPRENFVKKQITKNEEKIRSEIEFCQMPEEKKNQRVIHQTNKIR